VACAHHDDDWSCMFEDFHRYIRSHHSGQLVDWYAVVIKHIAEPDDDSIPSHRLARVVGPDVPVKAFKHTQPLFSLMSTGQSCPSPESHSADHKASFI